MDIYIGTYTGPKSQGIYRARLDLQSGKRVVRSCAGGRRRTTLSFIIILHPHGKFLYAVNENGMENGKEAGAVSSFAIDAATGNLNLINRQPSHGTYPCHLSIDPTGKCLMVANYGTGTFASYPLAADGSIGAAASVIQDKGKGPVADRQEGPHAHGIWPWPTPADGGGILALVLGCDLGTDELRARNSFRRAANMTLTDYNPRASAMPPGTGPRHLVHPSTNGCFYVIGELANTISVMELGKGEIWVTQTISTLPPHFTGKNTAAEVAVHPNGKFLYATNRGADDLVTYSIDPLGRQAHRSRLHPCRRPRTPRFFHRSHRKVADRRQPGFQRHHRLRHRPRHRPAAAGRQADTDLQPGL